MRRLVRVPLASLAAVALVVTPVLAGTSAAAPGKGGHGRSAAEQPAKAEATKAGKPVRAEKPAKAERPEKAEPRAASALPAAKPARSKQDGKRGVKAKVVVVGVVSATSTVSTGATSTVLVTIRVRGGDKEYRGRTVQVALDARTVVKRNHGKRVRYELRVGDKVTVHARRAAGGGLTATSISASGRPHVVPATPAATSTATTTATTTP